MKTAAKLLTLQIITKYFLKKTTKVKTVTKKPA
jgi:hypothetical protein